MDARLHWNEIYAGCSAQSAHYIDVHYDGVSNQPASRLFTQPFIQTQIKENIKAPRHWPLCVEFTGTGEFPAQRASDLMTSSCNEPCVAKSC